MHICYEGLAQSWQSLLCNKVKYTEVCIGESSQEVSVECDEKWCPYIHECDENHLLMETNDGEA